MTRALLHQTTRVAILLEDDTRNLAELLTAVAALVGLVLAVAVFVKPAVILAADVVEALDFTVKVMTIGITALLFGLGVSRC